MNALDIHVLPNATRRVKGRERIADQFGLGQMRDSYETVWRQTVEGRRPPLSGARRAADASANYIARVRARFVKAHPDHRRIARGAAWVSLFVLVGKSAGALKETAIAYRYGVSSLVDAYQLSFTLVSWIPSMLVTVLIPALVRMRDSSNEQIACFVGELRGMACVLGLALSAALVFAAPMLIGLFSGTLPDHTRTLAASFILGLAPIAPLTLFMCIDAARLQARERHVNTLLEALPAAVLFIVVLVNHGASIAPLCFAITFDLTLQIILLSRFASRADHVHARIRIGMKSPQWRDIAHSVGILLVNQALLICIVPLDQIYGDSAWRRRSPDSRIFQPAHRTHARARCFRDRARDIAGLDSDHSQRRACASESDGAQMSVSHVRLGRDRRMRHFICRAAACAGAFSAWHVRKTPSRLRPCCAGSPCSWRRTSRRSC